MRRVLTAVLATAILLSLTRLSSSFGASPELSGGGSESGIAACYHGRLKGRRTATGQRYNPNALTAAHATIPIGTHVKVTNIENGRSVVATVNDKMSGHAGGIIMDVSQRSCKELGSLAAVKPRSNSKCSARRQPLAKSQ